MENQLTPKELAIEIIQILNEKNAADIKLLHVTDKTIIADYFIICSGLSNTQVKSFTGEVEYKMGLKEIKPHHIEGYNEASWVVLDYRSVIVHVFYKDTREFYGLEKLCSDCRRGRHFPSADRKIMEENNHERT